MASSPGISRGVPTVDGRASSPHKSRLIACGKKAAGLAVAAAVVVAVPVVAAWVMVASLRAHAVIRGSGPLERWSLVRPEPHAKLADPARLSAVPASLVVEIDRHPEARAKQAPTDDETSSTAVGSNLSDAGRAADLQVVAAAPPVEPAPDSVSSPPKESVAEVIPLPPVNPVVPPHKPPKEERSAARDGGPRLASAPAVSPATRNKRDPGEEMLTALRQRVDPPLPDPRRDDVVGSVSAYNNPDLPRARSSRIAVYDITSHTVHLPNGERLEAHSGLGGDFDNPRSARVRNRGVTPPNVYDLALRERPFHGVAALRLKPVGTESMFGRDGILAHSYLLGPRGESNGCVSFRDYDRFLQAYRRGEVSRLLVVPRVTGSPASMVARLRTSDMQSADGSKEAGR
jgi:hypothetical protein